MGIKWVPVQAVVKSTISLSRFDSFGSALWPQSNALWQYYGGLGKWMTMSCTPLCLLSSSYAARKVLACVAAQRKSQAVEWYGFTVAIEMGERAPVTALSIKGHGISGFSFLTTLIHPPHSPSCHIFASRHSYENFFSLLSDVASDALVFCFQFFIHLSLWKVTSLLCVRYISITSNTHTLTHEHTKGEVCNFYAKSRILFFFFFGAGQLGERWLNQCLEQLIIFANYIVAPLKIWQDSISWITFTGTTLPC